MNSTEYFSFDKVPAFSKFDTAYANRNPDLRQFIQYEPDIQGILQAAKDRSKFPVNRKVLQEVLQEQYKDQPSDQSSLSSISKLLNENTFTCITAHQPCLFLGPLFTVYKILSTIKLTRMLNEEQSEFEFIPLFILGAEDHDVEEINHFHLFNKKYSWDTNQSGPCGRFNLEGLDEIISELQEVLGDSPNAQSLLSLLTHSYQSGKSYGKATRDFVTALFSAYGLLVLDMDDKKLKQAFLSHIENEVFENLAIKYIGDTQAKMQEAGYKSATYLRPINFFYLGNGQRERIEQVGEDYIMHISYQKFDKNELLSEIQGNPQNFSPNVNVRPIYQEFSVPNVAYVGGGGELAYWIERKSHFEVLNVFYPVLVRRDSVIVLDSNTSSKIEKSTLSTDAYFLDIDDIINNFLENNLEGHQDIDQEKNSIEQLLDQIVLKGAQTDTTLKAAFEAEKVRILKSLEQLEGRIKRAEKQNHDVRINQIRMIKEKMFPNNQLQERYDSFIGYYLKYGSGFFDQVLDHLDPLRRELKIIRLEG